MKRLLFACLFLLMASASVCAQNTTVSGTITDSPDGQAWFGGTFSFVFRVSPSNPTAQYFFNGVPFSSSQTIAGTLDGSAHYSQGVPPNTSITPSGSTWDVTFCPLATAQCVTYQSVTVTGATQTFAPAPASIRINLAVPLQNPRAYTDAEVINGALGQSYFNIISSGVRLCSSFPCGWTSGSGGGGNPAAPNQSVQINSGGVFGPGPLVSTVAINPQANDNICYVSPNGNDTNDGLGVGTGHAKLTIYSCLTTVLPGGTSTTAGNGTILISGFPSYGGPVTNQGFWLMGGTDPNFASPPTGWLKTNASFPQTINFDCFASYLSEASGNTPRCGFLAGSNSPVLTPIWISGVAGNIAFNNLELNNFLGNYIRLGIDSTGNRNGLGGDSGISFNNVGFNVGGCSSASTQKGPGIDIGSNTFWIWFRKLDGSGCPKEIFTVAASGAVRSSGVTTITTTATNDISTGELVTIANVPGVSSSDDSFNGSFNVTVVDSTHFTYTNPGPNETSAGTGQVVTARTAAMNIDPGTGPGSGLIYIDDTNFNGGGIRFTPGTNGGGFYARNISYEGAGSGSGIPDAPTILITSTRTTSNAAGTNIAIDNIQVSDPNNINITPGVQVDNASAFPGLVTVRQVSSYVRGRMTVLDGTAIGPTNINPTATYLRQGQFGIRQGQITATGIDQARRGFSPVVAKAANLAATSPSSWTFVSGTGTVTTGINTTGLDGTNNAGRVTYSSGTPSAVIQFYGSSSALNLGDVYVFGVWARSATNNGYSGNVPPIQFVFTAGALGSGDACVTSNISSGSVILGNIMGSQQSDGQWQWYSGLCKVLSNPTIPGTSFGGVVDSTHTTDFYAPTLYLFPSGTISDNEAYEIAINLAPTPSTASTAEVSMLPNQLFRQGSINFSGLAALTPNNGASIFCTDCTTTIPCAGGGTGAQAQRINGAWSCSNGAGINTGTQNCITDWATTSTLGTICSNVSGQVPTAQNGAPSIFTSPSFTDSASSPVVTTPYTIGCDTATSLIDRGHSIRFQTGASAITIPLSSASGCPGLVTTAVNDNAATLTFTRTVGDTLTVCNGASCADSQTSFALTTGQDATITQNAANLWLIRIHSSGGGVSSVSGDTGLFCNVTSTGAVTLVPCSTTLAHRFWANTSGSTGTATFNLITIADLPTGIPNANLLNPSTTVNTQTCTLGSSCTITYANIPAGALANGTTATTQTVGDTSTDVATDQFVANYHPSLDKSSTGLSNPTADATFTYPASSTQGFVLSGTAPASVSTATGTQASSIFQVLGVAGGATSNATGTGGVGSAPAISGGQGGAGTGTNAVGGAGGALLFTAGAGGSSSGTGANANGGDVKLQPGAAGTGGSGTAGKNGVVAVQGVGAGAAYFTQGATHSTSTDDIPANSIIEEAPTAVTAYTIVKPGTGAQGNETGTLSGSVITQSFSGDSNHSATVTIGSGTSIGSTSLCPSANCPAGTYRVNVYVDITTACGTSGTYVVNLIYTDDQGSKTVPVNINGTGAVASTGVLTTTSTANFGENAQILRSTGAASINYSTTATACGTAGPMVGKLYLSVEAVQ